MTMRQTINRNNDLRGLEKEGGGRGAAPGLLSLRQAFLHIDSGQRNPGNKRTGTTDGPEVPPVAGLQTLTGTGLPVTAEHVSLGTLTGEGSVCVDTGVLTTMVAQQAVISSCKTQQPGEMVREASGLLMWELSDHHAFLSHLTPRPAVRREHSRGLPRAEKKAKESREHNLPSSAVLTFSNPGANLSPGREARRARGLTGAGLEVLVDEEAFRALADEGLLGVQTQLLTAMVLLRTVIHSCGCHT